MVLVATTTVSSGQGVWLLAVLGVVVLGIVGVLFVCFNRDDEDVAQETANRIEIIEDE